MTTHSYPSSPDTPVLQMAYRSYAGMYTLLRLFSIDLPELQLEFSPEDFAAFYDGFRDRETEIDHAAGEEPKPEFYWIKGKDCWIRVCFEAHEGYYEWSCYTTAPNVNRIRVYFGEMNRNYPH
ncbi:hypothetical protein JHJ32_10220 [Parapedobacter sp. ISTM3]|uniref:hypothetical protein n=1 Tax=Parapedobacter sp. ISTM3 TaxID=2800130 RepID=UPI001904D10A|nr:hypothetical protein [Parapedobacter sp. ISTM3]MBK1440360.1 hypothetical protein [Parapedobacter sp. ISTM3]